MKNFEIAQIFYEMADILEMKNVQWKPRAYRRAAKAIETLTETVEEVYKKDGIKGLEEISGVGERLAKKIEEFLDTGKVKEYDRLKKMIPARLSELLEIESMGPRKANRLYKELGIKTIAQLERACKEHKVAKLRGFGPKAEENILLGIEMWKSGKERMLLGEVLPICHEIISALKKLKEVDRISEAGSLRRRKETIGDLDILITSSKPAKVADFFVSMPMVKRILAKGATRSSVILKNGLHTDLRVVEDAAFGSALQYFTGSKFHNIHTRQIAIKKGYKLSEYGIFSRRTGKRVAGRTEQEVYKALGLPYIEPELRENKGEIEAAIKGKLPNLVEKKDIRGDLHAHTKWSDGSATIEDMAKAARALGYEYICISDHSKTRVIAHGLDEDRILKQIAEIKKINQKLKGIKVLAGSEVDILANGELDFSDDLLKKLDIVIASVHSGFKTPENKMTERICTALENRYLDILGHPTGRIILSRAPYAINLNNVFDVALQNKKHMELDAFPDRLDLNDDNVRAAIEKGLKISIGTDAHNPDQLHMMDFGIYTARRGWAEKKDILNTYSLEQLKKFFPKIH
jgi:DNA polymerase (family 10)